MIRSILLCMTLFTASSLGSQEVSKEPFPFTHRALFITKVGFSKDRATDEPLPFWAINGEVRYRIHPYEKMGGGYFQMITPFSLYHFPKKDAILAEIRIRPDFGPIAQWIPLGMVDIGYSWGSKDWFTGSDDEQVHSLSIGGWFIVPLKVPNDGIFMVQGGTAIAGDKLTRFSCYTHWFFTEYIGITIHGDNFIRKKDDQRVQYGSMNFGIVVRI